MSSHSSQYTEREIRQLDFLSHFDLEFRHVRESENGVAGALLRIEINSRPFSPCIAYAEIAAKQQREGITSHGVLNLATLPFGANIQVVCDRSTGVPRPAVAVTLRKIFDTLHGLTHPGTKASVRIIMERFAWNVLQKDVREWTRCCIPCQTTKVRRHNKAPIGTFGNIGVLPQCPYRSGRSPFPITRAPFPPFLCGLFHSMV